MPDALSLRVKDQADLAQQQHCHRLNALAFSLHRSTLVQPLRSPQNVPYASPRTQAAGSAEAARLEALKAELETRYYRLVRARDAGSVAEIVAANTRITELEQRIEKVAAELGKIDTTRSVPSGTIHLYSITVPGLSVSGYLEAVYAPERWVLDTHSLSEELRERLEAYLLGGRDALPYWHDPRPSRLRYRANPRATEEARALMVALWDRVFSVPAAETRVPAHAGPTQPASPGLL